jgi:hypothetical protein|tara:strand:- start:999 stop:1226 length:228 start_codon:yes stop_codon:yes gene_type:complete
MITNEEDYTVSIPKRIEELVIDEEISYMDAVIQTSDEMGVEPGFAAKYLTKPIVERIQSEAEDKNLLPKTAKLPF